MEIPELFTYQLEHQQQISFEVEHHPYVFPLILFDLTLLFCFKFVQSIHLDSLDTRYTSNIVSNRFKPLIAYTSPNSNAFERTPTIVTLPPAPNLTVRHGNLLRKNSNDIDDLTKLLMKTMHSTNAPNVFGMCARCNDEIVGEENGLVAMDRMYHVSCFTCTMCGCRLRGMHFYSMENKPYCESCYIVCVIIIFVLFFL